MAVLKRITLFDLDGREQINHRLHMPPFSGLGVSVWGLVHACFEKLCESLERNQGLGPLRLSPLEPSSKGPKNWVAVKELKLSYHNGL